MITLPIQYAIRKNDKNEVECSVVLNIEFDINARTLVLTELNYQVCVFSETQTLKYASPYIESLRKALEEFDVIRTNVYCHRLVKP